MRSYAVPAFGLPFLCWYVAVQNLDGHCWCCRHPGCYRCRGLRQGKATTWVASGPMLLFSLLLRFLLLQAVGSKAFISEATAEFNVNVLGALRSTYELLPLLRGSIHFSATDGAAAACGSSSDGTFAAPAASSKLPAPATAARKSLFKETSLTSTAATSVTFCKVLLDCLASFWGVSLCLPSRIIFLGSALAHAAPPGQCLYAATKAAAVAACKGLSAEFRGTGIRVISVGKRRIPAQSSEAREFALFWYVRANVSRAFAERCSGTGLRGSLFHKLEA